jgi:hypothetical protein
MNREPDPTVRYSAKFLREHNRKRRRSMLVGAILTLCVAVALLAESWHAYRRHAWVKLPVRPTDHWLVPPILGGAAGALAVLVGFYCLWIYWNERP